MKRSKIARRIMAYLAATAIVVSVGFMGTSFHSNAETQYISAPNGAVVRETASAESGFKDRVDLGSKVEVISSQTGEDGYKWNKVSYSKEGTERDGWVRSDLMTYDAPGGTTTEEPETTTPSTTPSTTPEQPDTTTQPDTQEPTGTDTQEPTGTDIQEPEVDFTMPSADISGDGYLANGEQSFDVMGSTMTIVTFTDDQIPFGFNRTDITYNNASVSGLKYQYGEICLVYLTNEAGAGEFFVLDTTQNIVHSFVALSAGNHQLIMLVPPADAQIASSYGKTIYATDEDSGVTAYQYNQTLDTTNVTTVVEEYYYVYGMTQSGIPGWYLYDDVEKTFVRATTDLSVELDSLQATEQTPVVEEDNSLERMIIVAMGALCLIFIILTIVFGIRSARARKGFKVAEEYEEEEEDDGLNFIQRRKQERKYRHFMENFEEEGDEAWEHLLPEHERIPKQDKIVSQVDEAGWKESEKKKADFDVLVSDDADYDLPEDSTEEEIKSFDDIENILLAGLEESVTELDKEAEEVKEQPQPTSEEEPTSEEQPVSDEESEYEQLELPIFDQEEAPVDKESELPEELPAETEVVEKKKKEDGWKDLEFLDI